VILQTRGGRNVEMRAFADSSTNPPQRSVGNASGVAVTAESVAGVPAFTRAIRIAAEAVASLRMRVWTGEGVKRQRTDSAWQARFFRDAVNEQQSRFIFWETIEESLSKRGNAYVWLNIDPDTQRPTELFALHPDQVLPMLLPEGLFYNVVVVPGFVDPVGKGYGFYRKGPDTILHIRGHGSGGGVVAPSPIQVFRESLGVGVARLVHEGNTYNRGSSLRLAVTFPSEKSVDQAAEWRDMWRASYEGASGQSTAVLGGGATLTPISMTLADSQFIESQEFGVAECARIVGVPVSMLDTGGRRGTSTPITPEHEQMRWLRYGLGGRLERIESAFLHYPALFAPDSSVYPAFDTEKFIRGDLITEDAIAHQRVQDGRLLVDEWRAEQGLPDLPDGKGKIPQIVPVGGGPNPAATAPPPAAPPDDTQD
jgi:HK97 family phage portal protein